MEDFKNNQKLTKVWNCCFYGTFVNMYLWIILKNNGGFFVFLKLALFCREFTNLIFEIKF